MVGIVLASHGFMAQGMEDSCKLFFGDEIEQLAACCLASGEAPDQFRERMAIAIEEVSTGDGVIVLVDLLGGTPSNCCLSLVDDRVRVVTGMNLGMLLELLGTRMGIDDIDEIDVTELMKMGKRGIVCLNDLQASLCR